MDAIFMKQATELAIENVKNGGGPFGAVIVKDGKIVATGVNRVTANNDPTAHAEIQAIRNACRELDTFELKGCKIYSSCEPCPMCLGAIYWSRMTHLYYGCNQNDADKIGFSDEFIYKELEKTQKERSIVTENICREDSLRAFKAWEEKEDKVEY